ncbi:unnamed protein product [Mesocestoides corti]|nr:unnamed protein product [Mesocestoides corti]
MWFADGCAALQSAINFVPHYMLLLLSLLIFISPIDPTKAAQDFTAYRLTQYDAFDSEIGSRMSSLSCDIQTLSTGTYARRCLLMKLIEVTKETLRAAISNNAGGIIIILPTGGWSDDLLAHWLSLESELLLDNLEVAVYFTTESADLEPVFLELKELSHKTDLAGGPSLLDSVFSTGYRAYANAPKPIALNNMDLINIEGKLIADGYDSKKPTVILSAYYDAGGAIPSLAYGANANAAGVAVLLEVARILSQLTDSKNVPKFNVLFLLTGGGKLNFLGSKRWLEMISEDTAGIALLDSVVQVLSLEGLGTVEDNLLRLHVSRIPKEGTFIHRLLSALEVAAMLHPLTNCTTSTTITPTVEVVHKKINLNHYDLAWEHERFALHRLPTATLSGWSSPVSYKFRNSLLDGGPLNGRASPSRGYWGSVQPEIVARNARVLAEALVRVLYDTSSTMPVAEEFPFIDSSWSTATSAGALLDFLTMRPRSPQLLTAPPPRPNQATPGGTGLIQSLELYMRSYLAEVRLTRHHFSKKQQTATGTNGKSAGKQVQEETGPGAGVPVGSMPSMSAAGKDPEITFYAAVSPQKITIYR